MERTLVVLKPDAVARGLVGRLIQRFEDGGFKIVGAKMAVMDAEFTRKHYFDLEERLGEAVDEFLGRTDAGGRHVKRSEPLNMGLTSTDAGRIDEAQAFHPVVLTFLFQREQIGFLVDVLGDDEFPCRAMGHIVFLAKFFSEDIAGDTVASL